jgi:hypothetical protein
MKCAISRLLAKAFLALFFIGLVANFPVVDRITHTITLRNAEAGGPASPRGTARRTARRTTRRRVALGTRAYALPGGCRSVVRRGVKYHHCDGVYYQPYYEGDTVVYVVVEEP